MAEHVRQIKDSNGDLVYPKTKVAAISDFDAESHIVNRNQSAGVVVFPTLTDNLNGTFTVGPYQARFFIGNDFTGDIRLFEVPGGTFTPTQYILSYLVADYNAGSPVTRLITDVSLITEANVIPVSTVYRHELDIHHMTWDHLGIGLSNKLHQRLVKTQRFARETGLMISESTGRYMQITAGAVWYGAVRVALEACDSTVHGFHLYYHVAGSWITQSDHISVYNNTQYDNGTALVNANPNTYLINWLYRGVEPEQHVYMVLGSQAYGKLGDAQLAQPRSDLPVEIAAHAMLIGKIIVKQGDPTASAIQSVFDLAFVSTESGGATTHNDLAGLQGGTAGQYYHLSLTIYTDLTDGGDSALHYHSSDRNRANHTGTQSADTLTDGTANKVYTVAEKTKLAGIEAGAEVNNLSDVNATDLTDGGHTTLHKHSKIEDATSVNNAEVATGAGGVTITRNVWDTAPALVVNRRAPQVGAILAKFQTDFSDVFVFSAGGVFGCNTMEIPGMGANYGQIKMEWTGIQHNRNLADAHPVVKINNLNASATGRLLDMMFNSVTKAYFDKDGNLTIGANQLTAAKIAKLDGIEAGATADMTAAEILAAIKTVDGSGSGLDADLLDGKESATAATNDTIAARDASGQLYATSLNTSRAAEATAATNYLFEAGDGFIRKKSLANVKDELGTIVASGTGTNHWWVKFADGLLIKGGTVTFTGTVSTAWGQLFTNATAQTLTYDTSVAFIGNPNVTFTPKSSPNNYLVDVWAYLGTTTNTQYWLVSAISRVSQTYTIEWTAIGRWK